MSFKLSQIAQVLAVGAVCMLSGCTGASGPPPWQHQATGRATSGVAAPAKSTAPASGTKVCDQRILNSPWDYAGAAGTFTAASEPKGLPTFGSAGTDFPSATQLVVVAAGDNTSAASNGAYAGNNTVFYFEPGDHRVENGMSTGHKSVYVGGYSKAVGEAAIDGVDGATHGTGVGGQQATFSSPSSGANVYDTYEYLTIKNFSSTTNNSVLGNTQNGDSDVGDTYKYDTIGPNDYGYTGSNSAPATGESSGGGYAINASSYTTIEDNCLTHDAQGAFNVTNAVDLTVKNNEISWNGLGEYPDTSGPGGSPFSCGCSGGGKIFYSLNASIVGNYVHDNYNVGIWFDFDNAGALISDNYIANNWSNGIAYEAGYNARITDNTVIGNGWASDHPWPAGVHGKDCYGGVPCGGGEGPVTGAGGGNPFAAIDVSDSGGNANLKSRYADTFLIEGNVLTNNFGGVKVYTDTNRYPGNIDDDSACGVPLGPLNQNNSSVYYKQGKILVTNGDTSISGSSVQASGGTMTICAGYGSSQDNGSDSKMQNTVRWHGRVRPELGCLPRHGDERHERALVHPQRFARGRVREVAAAVRLRRLRARGLLRGQTRRGVGQPEGHVLGQLRLGFPQRHGERQRFLARRVRGEGLRGGGKPVRLHDDGGLQRRRSQAHAVLRRLPDVHRRRHWRPGQRLVGQHVPVVGKRRMAVRGGRSGKPGVPRSVARRAVPPGRR